MMVMMVVLAKAQVWQVTQGRAPAAAAINNGDGVVAMACMGSMMMLGQ
jgi:hypothetical protein